MKAEKASAPPAFFEQCERGDLTIDYPQRRVTMAGRPVALTGIEYRMLVELGDDASNPDYIFAEPRFGYRMPEEEAKP